MRRLVYLILMALVPITSSAQVGTVCDGNLSLTEVIWQAGGSVSLGWRELPIFAMARAYSMEELIHARVQSHFSQEVAELHPECIDHHIYGSALSYRYIYFQLTRGESADLDSRITAKVRFEFWGNIYTDSSGGNYFDPNFVINTPSSMEGEWNGTVLLPDARAQAATFKNAGSGKGWVSFESSINPGEEKGDIQRIKITVNMNKPARPHPKWVIMANVDVIPSSFLVEGGASIRRVPYVEARAILNPVASKSEDGPGATPTAGTDLESLGIVSNQIGDLRDDDKDSDNDGLPDHVEIDLGTNPLDPDTDGDGYTDKQEADVGSSPHDPDDDPDFVFSSSFEEPK